MKFTSNMLKWLGRLLLRRRGGHETSAPLSSAPSKVPPPPRKRVIVDGTDDRARLVQRFMDQGRIAILLRPQIASTLNAEHLATVREAFQQEMARLEEGEVVLSPWLLDEDETIASKIPRKHEIVGPCYIDRFPITNRLFRDFVADGGYGQQSLWDAAVWPRVSEFSDRTGVSGPRYWSNGMFPDGDEDLPVVGVSWFEAQAYARWSGRRLPTDAEWLMAAGGPSLTAAGEPIQRRFPWGESHDQQRANLGNLGLGKPNAVTQFLGGSSAQGISQLIGNVWEWTASDLSVMSYGKEVRFDAPLKCLRGGAFDSYFEGQASSQFQSGDSALARRHNVGFRCALSNSDIVQLELSA